jgi:hypothetical protein
METRYYGELLPTIALPVSAVTVDAALALREDIVTGPVRRQSEPQHGQRIRFQGATAAAALGRVAVGSAAICVMEGSRRSGAIDMHRPIERKRTDINGVPPRGKPV